MEKEVQNTDVQPLIRDYHASMHAAIGAAVVVNLEDDKTYFYEDELRDHMKAEDGAYYRLVKCVDVGEAVYWTSAETEADTHDQYIGSELQLPDKDRIKRMARFHQKLLNTYGNTYGTDN